MNFLPAWGTGGAHGAGGRGGRRKPWPDFSKHTALFLCGVWKPVEGDGSAFPRMNPQLPPCRDLESLRGREATSIRRGWGMWGQHGDTLNKEAADLVMSWEAAPFLGKQVGIHN